jgi:hypothetical protein
MQMQRPWGGGGFDGWQSAGPGGFGGAPQNGDWRFAGSPPRGPPGVFPGGLPSGPPGGPRGGGQFGSGRFGPAGDFPMRGFGGGVDPTFDGSADMFPGEEGGVRPEDFRQRYANQFSFPNGGDGDRSHFEDGDRRDLPFIGRHRPHMFGHHGGYQRPDIDHGVYVDDGTQFEDAHRHNLPFIGRRRPHVFPYQGHYAGQGVGPGFQEDDNGIGRRHRFPFHRRHDDDEQPIQGQQQPYVYSHGQDGVPNDNPYVPLGAPVSRPSDDGEFSVSPDGLGPYNSAGLLPGLRTKYHAEVPVKNIIVNAVCIGDPISLPAARSMNVFADHCGPICRYRSFNILSFLAIDPRSDTQTAMT